MERICHLHKVAMRTVLGIIIKILTFQGRNRTKPTASKLYFLFAYRLRKSFKTDVVVFQFQKKKLTNTTRLLYLLQQFQFKQR